VEPEKPSLATWWSADKYMYVAPPGVQGTN